MQSDQQAAPNSVQFVKFLKRTPYKLRERGPAPPLRAVGALACTSRRWRDLVANDGLFQFVLANSGRHPQHAINGSWRVAFRRSLFIDASWKGRRFQKKEVRLRPLANRFPHYQYLFP